MKKAKQFLAMLLCLTMVIAVIPANAQASTADGELTELYYNFKYTEAELKTLNGGTMLELIQATDYSKTGRNWCFYNYPTSAWAGASTQWDGRLSFAGCGLQLRTEKENLWAAVEIDVTQAADYNIVLDYAKYSSGSVSEIYMFPAPTENSVAAVEACLTAANLKGSVNFADANNAGLGFNTELGSININQAGKYILVIRGTSADDGNFAFVSGLKLVPKGLYNFSLRYPTYSDADFKAYDKENWQYYASSDGIAIYDKNSEAGGTPAWTTPQFHYFTQDGMFLAFELKNLIEGEYEVSMMAQKGSSSCAADFYIIPKCDASKILENCTDEYHIGYHDNNGSDAAPVEFDFDKAAQIRADGNYLFVAVAKVKDAAKHRLNFFGVKMVRTGDAKPVGYRKYTFNFVGATWGGSNSNNFIKYGSEEKGWKHYAENNLTVQTNWKEDGTGWDYVAVRDVNSSNNWVALQLYNLKAGKYNATVNAYMNANYPAVELFFIPVCDAKQIAGKLTAPKSLGEVDSNDATAKFEKKAIPVEGSINVPTDGNYLLVIRGKDSNPTPTFHMNSLEMERVGEYEKTAEVYSYSLRTHNDKTNYKTYDSGSWKYYASSDSVTLVDHQNWTTPMFQNFNVGDYLAFEIKNLESGAYDVSAEAWTTSAGCRAEYYIMPKCDVSKIAENLKRDNKYYIGEHNNYTTDQVTGVEVDFTNAAQLEADGNYLLVMKCIARMSDGSHNIRIANFELERTGDYVAPEEPVEIVNAEIFGDVSAYITKDGTFTAFAGIDTTSYKEVGFYIAQGDGSFEKYAVADGKVYKSINIKWGDGENDKTDIGVDKFFTKTAAGENAYVFFSGTTLDGTTTTVKFYPYAVPAEGAEITGHTYSVTLSK